MNVWKKKECCDPSFFIALCALQSPVNKSSVAHTAPVACLSQFLCGNAQPYAKCFCGCRWRESKRGKVCTPCIRLFIFFPPISPPALCWVSLGSRGRHRWLPCCALLKESGGQVGTRKKCRLLVGPQQTPFVSPSRLSATGQHRTSVTEKKKREAGAKDNRRAVLTTIGLEKVNFLFFFFWFLFCTRINQRAQRQ